MPSPGEPRQAECEQSRPRGRAELVRVIAFDPHEVGQDTANWTTEKLAAYLGQHTSVLVTEDTVRVSLHAHDDGGLASDLDGCKRQAEEQADSVGNARLGRGAFSWCHSTRTSPHQRCGGG